MFASPECDLSIEVRSTARPGAQRTIEVGGLGSGALVTVHSVCIRLQRRPHGPDDPPLKNERGTCVRVGVRVRKAGRADIDGSATGWL